MVSGHVHIILGCGFDSSPPLLSSSSHENGKLHKITRLESGLLFPEINIGIPKDHSKSAMHSLKMPCYEQILQKEQNCIGFVIVISDSYSFNLTLRLNELSTTNRIGLRLKLFSRAFISSPILLLLMIGSLRKAC